MGKSTISMAIFHSYVSDPMVKMVHSPAKKYVFLAGMPKIHHVFSTRPDGIASTVLLSGKHTKKQKNIENCHRNSGFTHEKWWIFPLLCDSLPEGSVYCLFILVAIQTKLAVFIELQAGS